MGYIFFHPLIRKTFTTVGFLAFIYLWFSVIVLSLSVLDGTDYKKYSTSLVIVYDDQDSLQERLSSVLPFVDFFNEVIVAYECQLSKEVPCVESWVRMYCSSYSHENEIINEVITHIVDQNNELVMILPPKTKIKNVDFYSVFQSFDEDSGLAAVGGKLVFEDYLLTTGVDFSKDEDEGVTFFEVYDGFYDFYHRENDFVQSILKPGMIVRISDYIELGGFNYPMDVIDLSFRIFESEKKLQYMPEIAISYLDLESFFVMSEEAERHNRYANLKSTSIRRNNEEYRGRHLEETNLPEFRERWYPKLIDPASHEKKYRFHPKVAWDFGGGSCSGWFIEATNLVTHLQNSMTNLRIITGKSDFCEGLPKYVTNTLDRLIDRKFDNINIWISHKPPQRYPSFEGDMYDGLVKVEGRPDYVIGRSMYETTRIPDLWIDQIDKYVDEVWVPSMFVKQTFEDSGVDPDKLVYIPETLDPYFYDPDATRSFREEYPEHWISELLEKTEFNFFSVFKWEERKGYKFLIEAYVKEFSRKDNTTLFILTYHPNYRQPTFAKQKIEIEILEMVNKFTNDEAFQNREAWDIPNIEIICEEEPFPTLQMPSLYKSMDSFVLPTRGEGFGLPIFEAMLMRLPSIVTGFSGHLDFANDENSYLIKVEDLEMVDRHFHKKDVYVSSSTYFSEKNKNVVDNHRVSQYDDEKISAWARPSVSHLRVLMRYVLENREDAKMTAERGREYIIEHFSPEVVTDIILDRLEVISGKIEEKKKRNAKME